MSTHEQFGLALAKAVLEVAEELQKAAPPHQAAIEANVAQRKNARAAALGEHPQAGLRAQKLQATALARPGTSDVSPWRDKSVIGQAQTANRAVHRLGEANASGRQVYHGATAEAVKMGVPANHSAITGANEVTKEDHDKAVAEQGARFDAQRKAAAAKAHRQTPEYSQQVAAERAKRKAGVRASMENNKLVNETGNVGSVPGLALSEAELRREIAISLAKAVLEVAEEAEKLEKKIPGRGYIAGALGAAAMALAPAPAQAGFVGSSARRAEAAESTRQYEQKKANNAQAAKWSQEAGGKDTIGPRTPAPSTPTPSKPHPSDHEGETNAIGAGVLGLAAGTLGALRRRSMTGQDSQFKLLPD